MRGGKSGGPPQTSHRALPQNFTVPFLRMAEKQRPYRVAVAGPAGMTDPLAPVAWI